MHEHVVKGEGQRGVVAVHHHRHAVAHQQNVDARRVNLCQRRRQTQSQEPLASFQLLVLHPLNALSASW